MRLLLHRMCLVSAFRLCGIPIPADVARAAADGVTVFEAGRPIAVVRFRTETVKPIPGAPRPHLKDAS